MTGWSFVGIISECWLLSLIQGLHYSLTHTHILYIQEPYFKCFAENSADGGRSGGCELRLQRGRPWLTQHYVWTCVIMEPFANRVDAGGHDYLSELRAWCFKMACITHWESEWEEKRKADGAGCFLKGCYRAVRTVVIETGRRGRTFSQAVTHSESQRPEEVITWRSSGE